jgi:hypothetical protein
MRPVPLALVAALAAAAACQPGQEQQHRALSRPPGRTARAVAADAAPPIALQLAGVDRLRIDLPFQGPVAPRDPRVDVTTPRGRLYAQLPVDVALDAQGGGTATAVLEVRGTPIDGYHLVGTWRFALVDGEGPPLATRAVDLE